MPVYSDPAPTISAVDVDPDTNIVTAVGSVGPTDCPNLQTWWEVDLSGDGSFLVVAALTFPVDATLLLVVSDTWTIPDGVNLRDSSIRLAARAELDLTQVWYSDPAVLVGAGFDTATFVPAPLPPGPPAGDAAPRTRGKIGPGVSRFVRDNSRR